MPRSLPRALLALSLLAILIATLTPSGDELDPLVLCVVCGAQGWSDALVNIILFLPLGAALALLARRGGWIVLGGCLLSCAVESAQLLLIPGRDPSIGDVLFNTLGTAAGVALVRTAPSWLAPPVRRARGLMAAAAAVAVSVFLATGCLLQPALPSSSYFGQWTPNLGHLTWYRARVLSAQLDSMPLPARHLGDSAAVRQQFLRGASLDVRAVAGPPTGGVGSLFSIYDEQQREILLLGPDRADLVFRLRRRSAEYRLDTPDLRVLGAMRGVRRGDTLALSVYREPTGWCVRLNGRMTCRLGFTLGRAWALLLYPESFPEWLRHALDAGWVAGMLLPFGFWVRRDATTLAAGGATVAALVFAPSLTGLQPLPLLELLGSAAGVATGWGLGVLARRRAI